MEKSERLKIEKAKSDHKEAMKKDPKGMEAKGDEIIRQIIGNPLPNWGNLKIQGIQI